MTQLLDEIRAMIAERGPISVEQYMQLALAHPDLGYYMNRDPFGATGDFTTAPEISQMFGELIGLWAAEVWSSMGSPDPVRLIELGPGRGTLMSDALRAARIVPAFRNALDVRLVETSPALAAMQHELLVDSGVAVSWAQTLKEVPDGPAIVIGNEFLDALPGGAQAAFEFRHRSWLSDEVYERLRTRGLALCVADSEKLSTPVELTADYAYFRLRDEGYAPRDITRWAHTIRDRTAACRDVFVYFKHEESGKGPEFARLLLDALKAS